VEEIKRIILLDVAQQSADASDSHRQSTTVGDDDRRAPGQPGDDG
jgi:hypothetical protein